MTSPIRTCARCNDDCHAIRHQLETELSQSRDDALEVAARVCDAVSAKSLKNRDNILNNPIVAATFNGGLAGAGECAAAIRSLKSKPAPIAGGDADMARCLAFADAMKEVAVWPIVICSGETVNEATRQGWLKTVRLAPFIPRLGQSSVISGITDAGRVKYHSLLNNAAIRKGAE